MSQTAALLAIDIGNSNIVFGLYHDHSLRSAWRAATDPLKTADEYAIILACWFRSTGLSFDQITGCVLASVVPPLGTTFSDLAQRYARCEALVVGAGLDLGMRNLTDAPHLVGADRLVNALAARETYGAPVIVIDLGTATTFDVVSAEGDFVGGVIAPGLGISAEALARQTARLSRVELAFPARAIGRNTVQSLQAGILYGYVGLIEGLMRRIQVELGGKARVIATGGLARIIAPRTRGVDVVDEYLTLDGLRMVFERNTRQKA